MADISKIQTLDGTTYDIKDTTARNLIPTNISDLTNDSGFITGMEILSYGSSTWNDFITAYNAKKVVYCRASSNSNPASGSQTHLAFMAYVNNADNPTSVEFQYYRSVSSHTDAQQGDQVYIYKLTSADTWTVTVREAYTKIIAGSNMTSNYANGTLTLNATDTTYESKVAASGGTDVSLVTTGEKYNWDSKGIPAGGTSGQVLKKSSSSDYAAEWGDESGGGIIVTITRSNNTYVADKTFEQITAAYQDGTLKYLVDATSTTKNIYSFYSIDENYVYFKRERVGSGSVWQDYFSISQSNHIFKNDTNAQIPDVPSPLNSNPIIWVEADTSTTPVTYSASSQGITDMYDVFPYDQSVFPMFTLKYIKATLGTGFPPRIADCEEFQLTDSYTTYTGTSSSNVEHTGHLVFSKACIIDGTPTIRKFEIAEEFGKGDNFQSATVTYFEEPLGSEDALPLTGGTMTGAINMGSNKITNLSTPTANSDAATKAYADSRGIPAGGSSGQVLKKSSATDYAVTWSNDNGKTLHISKSSFSSLPQTISNASITASMRVVNCVWGTPASITGNVTWTTAAGSLTLSGSISGSTTAEIDLIEF